MVSVSVCFLFSQSMDEKIKYGLFVFPPKKTLIWRRYCSTGQSCCSMTSKRTNAPERSLSQTKATRVCIRSINQSNRSICVVVCCFCFVCAFSFQGHTKIALSIHNQEKSLRKSISKCFDLFQILCTTNSLRKCVEIRLENLNGDIGV